MTELRLVVHPAPEWSGAYRIYVATDGKLLGIGRDVARTAAMRATEEGLAHDDTVIVFEYASGAPREHGRIRDLRNGAKMKVAA